MRAPRRRFALTSSAVALLGVASCTFPEGSQPTCDDDPEQCPRSSRSANVVSCDCTCEIGLFVGEETFRGAVPACLPPALNARIATGAQALALDTMPARDFDQRVYRFCSEDVAAFVRAVVRTQAKSRSACIVPVKCECTTAGARFETASCDVPCGDTPCTNETCHGVLRSDNSIDPSECLCTRAKACGTVVPDVDRRALCRP